MRKYLLIIFVLLTISCSEYPTRSKDRNRIKIDGRVVETHYTDSLLFSVRALSEVSLRLNHDILAETNKEGRYSFYIGKEGQYYLFAEKSDYKSHSTYLNVIKGDKLKRDFYLEKRDEPAHGWLTFPMTSDGGEIFITADGLCLTSRGRAEVYAIKTITVKNQKTYRFISSMRKDPNTQLIYFGVQPQIKGLDWVYEPTNLNNWRESIISCFINDTTIIGIDYIYDNAGAIIDTVYIYPETVDVVLKIGVELGSDFPTGYFREIKIEGV